MGAWGRLQRPPDPALTLRGALLPTKARSKTGISIWTASPFGAARYGKRESEFDGAVRNHLEDSGFSRASSSAKNAPLQDGAGFSSDVVDLTWLNVEVWPLYTRRMAAPHATSTAMPDGQLQTRRFVLRIIGPDDVSDEWLRWFSDSDLMRQRNAHAVKLKRADVQRYIIAAQRQRRLVIGIYERHSSRHVGLYELQINPEHKNLTIDVIVDPWRFDPHSVLMETDAVLLAHMAKAYGVQKAVAKVVETYSSALRHFGHAPWIKEGVLRFERTSVDGSRRLDVVQFGMLL